MIHLAPTTEIRGGRHRRAAGIGHAAGSIITSPLQRMSPAIYTAQLIDHSAPRLEENPPKVTRGRKTERGRESRDFIFLSANQLFDELI